MKTPEEIKVWAKRVHDEARIIGASGKSEEVANFACSVFGYAAKSIAYIQQLESELEAVKRERDAAVSDIKLSQSCSLCSHRPKDDECTVFRCMECDKVGCVCRGCFHGEKIEWRGVCQENTEVQEDG